MQRLRLLTDHDVQQFPFTKAVQVMQEAALLAETGQMHAPARLHAADLSFTAGSTAQSFGFRAYHTRDTPFHDQVVTVWDAQGRITGLVMGTQLGPLRTGALGALATNIMAAPQASRLGLIGSGTQAKAHALAVAATRSLSQILVYSPTAKNRDHLVRELVGLGLPAYAAEHPQQVCQYSDLLTLATSSSTPVIASAWVQPGTHLCTLGPKEQAQHEFPPDLAQYAALVATDSPAQLHAYQGGHVLAGQNVQSLGALLLAPPTRQPHDISLFLSVGLAGTEVMLAQAMLDQ